MTLKSELRETLFDVHFETRVSNLEGVSLKTYLVGFEFLYICSFITLYGMDYSDIEISYTNLLRYSIDQLFLGG
jgi:hypothetical protein